MKNLLTITAIAIFSFSLNANTTKPPSNELNKVFCEYVVESICDKQCKIVEIEDMIKTYEIFAEEEKDNKLFQQELQNLNQQLIKVHEDIQSLIDTLKIFLSKDDVQNKVLTIKRV